MRCSDTIERFFFSSFSRKETRRNRRRVVFKREIRCLYGAIQVGQRRWISRGIPLKFFCARTPRHPRHHRTERKVEGEREKAPLSSQLSRVAFSVDGGPPILPAFDLEDLVSPTNCSLPRGRSSNIDNVIIALPEPVDFFTSSRKRLVMPLANIYLKTRIFSFLHGASFTPLRHAYFGPTCYFQCVPSFPTLYSPSFLSSENKLIPKTSGKYLITYIEIIHYYYYILINPDSKYSKFLKKKKRKGTSFSSVLLTERTNSTPFSCRNEETGRYNNRASSETGKLEISSIKSANC